MGSDAWRALFERCGRNLDDIAPGFYDALGVEIDDILSAWHGEDFEQATIHADLFPDNVLMQGDAVTGLIDFYFACTDVRIYDLAVMHSAWSFDAAGHTYDPLIGNALIDGYDEVFPLAPAEQAEFATFASGACIRFALSRAWDWLNTPADALVTRKDPLAYWRRLTHYNPDLARFPG